MRRLLLDFDPNGGTDPLCMLNLFLKRTADVMRTADDACALCKQYIEQLDSKTVICSNNTFTIKKIVGIYKNELLV